MTDPVAASSVSVRPAATVMLLRDGDDGLEVFMLKRSGSSVFAGNSYVFPGGKVDDADAAVAYEPIADGVTDETVSARLGLDRGGLAWLVAAIRECFEEAGVLLARPTGSDHIIDFDGDEEQATFDAARHEVHDGTLSLLDLCARHDLQLLTDRLHLVAHWITPIGEPRRFDTRFFVTAAPTGQRPLHDDSETVASEWVAPSDAIGDAKAGSMRLLPPTIVNLEWLARFATAAEAIEAARAAPLPTPVMPKLVVDDANAVIGIIRPDEAGYDDAPEPEFVVERSKQGPPGESGLARR